MNHRKPSYLALFFTATAILCSANTANANTIAISAPPEEPLPKRLELDIGMMIGGLDMGTTRASATGLSISGGVRISDLSILGEFNHFALRADERGSMDRFGMTARYSIVPLGDEDSIGTGDLWVEGGVGWEHVTWRRGGVLDRPDLALGFGWQGNIRMDRKSDHPRYIGPYFALRALIAAGPQSDEEAVCGGPCDRATRPSPTDVSFMFHMGVNWGRTSF